MPWSRWTSWLEPLDPLEHPAVARALGVLEILGQELEVQLEGGERVADLVGQSAGELGDLGVLGAEPPRDFPLFGTRGGESSVAACRAAVGGGLPGAPFVGRGCAEFVGALTGASETVLDEGLPWESRR